MSGVDLRRDRPLHRVFFLSLFEEYIIDFKGSSLLFHKYPYFPLLNGLRSDPPLRMYLLLRTEENYEKCKDSKLILYCRRY